MDGMRYCGVDYGSKRVGLAISDAGGRIAFPKETVQNKGRAFVLTRLKSFCASEGVSRIIIGLPRGLDGAETEQTRDVRLFADALKKEISLPVDFEDEALTTHMVEKTGIRKEHADEAAAALILQSYLDRQSK